MTKHLRIFALVFCLLFAVSPAWAANNWAGSNAVAVWNFEDDLTDDSANSNTLTDYNTVSYVAAGYSSAPDATKALSVVRANKEGGYRQDAALSADFPLKTGVAVASWSITGWVYLDDDFDTYPIVWAKYDPDGNNRGAILYYYNGSLYFVVSYDGTNIVGVSISMSKDTWYHFGCTYDSSDDSIKLRLYEDGVGVSNDTDILPDNMNLSSEAFWVGLRWDGGLSTTTGHWDGYIDELVVFAGEALSDADIDKVRAGTYVAAGSIVPLLMQYYHSEN